MSGKNYRYSYILYHFVLWYVIDIQNMQMLSADSP